MRERIRRALRAILSPPVWVILTGVVLSVILLVVSFTYFPPVHPVSLAAYWISTYTLVVLCGAFRKLDRWVREAIREDRHGLLAAIRRRLDENERAARLRDDVDLRAMASLYLSLVLNVGYAVFKCVSGAVYHSSWLWAVGVYYLVIGSIRFLLLRDARTSRSLDPEERKERELKAYRRTGYLLILLDDIIFGMTIQMVLRGQSDEYSGVFIYVSAAYTFYYFGLAVVNMIRFRRRGSPLLSAAKNITFVSAVRSMFVLQTALLTAFSNGDDYFRRVMSAVSGAVVCVSVVYTAASMILRANRELAALKKDPAA